MNTLKESRFKLPGLKNHSSEIFFWMITGFLLSVYVFNVWKNNINLPVQDDYHNVLSYLNGIYDTHSVKDIFNSFLRVKKGFTSVLYLITVYTDYMIDHDVDYNLLVVFGHLVYLFLHFLILRSLHLSRDKYLLFIPYLLLTVFPIANAMNYYAIIGSYSMFLAGSFITLMLLDRPLNSLKFIALLIISLLTCFSFGAGIVLYVAGLFMLLIKQDYLKRKLLFYCWLVIGIVSILLFLNTLSGTREVQNDFAGNIPGIMAYPFSLSSGYITRILFSSEAIHSIFLPQNIGILISLMIFLPFTFFIYQKRSNLNKITLLISYLVLLLLTSGVMAVSRVPLFGLDNALSLRYELVGVQFFAIMYLILIRLTPRFNKANFWTILILGVFIYMIRYPAHVNQQARFTAGMETLIEKYYLRDYKYISENTNKGNIGYLIDKSIANGIYKVPEIKSSKSLKINTFDSIALAGMITNPIEFNINYFRESDLAFALTGCLDTVYTAEKFSVTNLILSGNKSTYLIERNTKSDVQKSGSQDSLLVNEAIMQDSNTCFDWIIVKKNLDIPDGDYELFLNIPGQINAEPVFFETGKIISISNHLNIADYRDLKNDSLSFNLNVWVNQKKQEAREVKFDSQNDELLFSCELEYPVSGFEDILLILKLNDKNEIYINLTKARNSELIYFSYPMQTQQLGGIAKDFEIKLVFIFDNHSKITQSVGEYIFIPN